MATVNIDSKLLQALQEATCFGLAHDEDAPECKQCDVKGQCRIKTEGGLNIPTPTTKPKSASTSKPAETKAKATTPKAPAKPKTTAKTTAQKQAPKPKTETKPASAPSGNLPDFKPMTLTELKDLAAERSVEWKDYGNDQITRMRLIMALKKSY